MRKIVVSLGVVCVLLALPALAQQPEEGTVTFGVLLTPKAGMEQQFEAGLKKHRDWHKQQNDSWTWLTAQILNGPRAGSYWVFTPWHRWEDFDNPPVAEEADAADRRANLDPYVESVEPSHWLYRAEVSRSWPRSEVPALIEVLRFQVYYDKGSDFEYAIEKFHHAIEKTNWPVRYLWYELRSGGEGPLYGLVLPRDNWAGFKPLEKPFPAMLEEAYGRVEAQALLK
jgi:hypothetical protein